MNRPSKGEMGYSSEDEGFENKHRAETVILETMGLGPSAGLENFPEKLKAAIKSLPQYQRFEKEMATVTDEQLPLALFQAIRKANDLPEERTDIPTDGVLISSIRQGHIECAGRTYIASTYLQERGLPHTVVEASSHSMLLFEIGNDTLGYCDANHNLYFTFPRAALKGYKGVNTISECKLEEYIPRPTDIADGLDVAYNHFITIPTDEREAADAIDTLQAEMFGEEDERLNQYYEQDQQMVSEREAQAIALQVKLKEILQTVKSEQEFTASFNSLMQGDEGKLFPYIRNAPNEVKLKYAKELWEHFKI